MLKEVAASSAGQRLSGQLDVGIHGQIHQLDGRHYFLHLLACIQTIQNGHGDIEHDQVRLQFGSSTHQGAAIADNSDHVKLRLEKPLA